MTLINKAQIIAVRAALARKGLMKVKEDIIRGASGGRTSSTAGLTMEEARSLLMALNSDRPEPANDLMIRKMMAQAHEMGWVKKVKRVGKSGNIEEVKDYSILYGWIEKYGYLKKPLRDYSYKELPKLVGQLEKVYNGYLNKF